MLKEFEFFHGSVFARLLHSRNEPVNLRRYSSTDNAAYVVDDAIGLFVKHSSKRLSPWRFSFQSRHQDEIVEMSHHLKKVFLLLVCNDDGIVTLSLDEVRRILDEVHQPVEWVSVARNKRKMYAVSGSDGLIGF
jgi:hypothetical protein